MGYFVISCGLTLVVGTCSLADYFYKKQGHRARYGKIDITCAATTFVIIVIEFGTRSPILETIALLMLTIVSFAFSGLSRSTGQWVCRHSLWHLIGSAEAVYCALRRPP